MATTMATTIAATATGTTTSTLHYPTLPQLCYTMLPYKPRLQYSNYKYSCSYNCATLHHTTLHETALLRSTLQHIPWHYMLCRYTHYHTATPTALREVHHTATRTPPRYSYNYSCVTAHYIQQLWVRWLPCIPASHLQNTIWDTPTLPFCSTFAYLELCFEPW